MKSLAVGYESEALLEKASKLAQRLGLPLDNHAKDCLLVTQNKLVLKCQSFSPLYADFACTTWQKRREAGKKQGLVKACKPAKGMQIIDATAGWGRDAAILASFGAEVTLIERQPIMYALLKDALDCQDERSKAVLKLKLIQSNAIDYLQTLSAPDFPDVIYIDPMHPERQKSALVKKDMQVLQQLIGADVDALALLTIAQKKALKRVVVKWPQHLVPLLKPSASIGGKTVRFDIYSPEG